MRNLVRNFLRNIEIKLIVSAGIGLVCYGLFVLLEGPPPAPPSPSVIYFDVGVGAGNASPPGE